MIDDIIPNNLTVSQEETQRRIAFCMPCENNVLEVIPKCTQCNCPISTISMLSFKSCPIGKW